MILHPPTKSLILKADDPMAIRELIPESRLLPTGDVQVKLTFDSAKALRALGHKAPSPIYLDYNWPGKHKPYEHQKEMASVMTLNERCFNLSEMGSMKSAATLWAADYLMTKGLVRKALILSPLSTVETVWMQEIFDVLMHRSAMLLIGSKMKRLERLGYDSDFYVMNHDGLGINIVRNALAERKDIDLVIVDEASFYRNGTTSKWRDIRDMLKAHQRLWMLTGTPCPNAPTDAYALAKLVNPAAVPGHFGAFRRLTMRNESYSHIPKWVPRPEGYELAYKAMQPAVRFEKKDCIDLPPVVVEKRHAEITKEQKQAFEDMRKTMQAEFIKAKNEGVQITAVNAADKIGKLRQILLGAIKVPETGEYEVIPHGPRLDVLKEIIDEAAGKVIVLVPYKGAIGVYADELKRHCSCEIMNGDTPVSERKRIVDRFQQEKDPRVLLCHDRVVSHGLNLTAANVTVLLGPISSHDNYCQAIERMNRAGQIRSMTIVRISGHKIEDEMYNTLDSRGEMQQNILRLYKEITEGKGL